MRALVFAALAAPFLASACAPKAPPAPPPPAITVKEESPDSSFIYMVPAEVTAIPGLSARLGEDMINVKGAFLKDVADFRKEFPDDPRGPIQLAYEAQWVKAGDAGPLTSVRMDLYTYMGGAHPTTDMQGLILQKSDGKELKLADLFAAPVDQTALPAELCKAIGAEKLERGMEALILDAQISCAGPDATVKLDGPVVFAPSTEPGKAAALRFLFPPYVIGAYVEGPYVIDVPAAAFQNSLKPEYRTAFGGAPAIEEEGATGVEP
jgi:hypothetical protein